LGDNEKPLLLSSISVALKLVALSLILWFGTCIVIAGIRYAIKT
jgi:hypothetical protein